MLTRIDIKNFKCFRDQSLDFNKLTILTGANGSGKSSLIQSILLIRQSYEQYLLPGIGLSLNGPLVHIGRGKDALFEAADTETIEITPWFGGRKTDGYTFRYAAEADVLACDPKDAKLVEEEDESEDTASDEERNFNFGFNFSYLNTERAGPKVLYPLSEYDVRGQNSIGSGGQFAAHFLCQFGRLKIPHPPLKHSTCNADSLIAQVEAWLREISPGIRVHATSSPAFEAAHLNYAFESGAEVSSGFRPTNVGFGISYVLPVLVSLLSRRSGELLIIENPESHLHPRGQFVLGRLCGLVAAQGVQLVVETHSDHFINGVRIAVKTKQIAKDDVTFCHFSRTGKDVHIAQIRVDEGGRLSEWPDGFFDEYERALNSLIE